MGKYLYKLGKILFKIYFIIFHRRKVWGRENIPESGPVMVVANHQSFGDPPLVGTVMNRQVFFLAKKELFSNSLFGWVLDQIGVIPIKRGKPDYSALKRSLQVLKNNKVLGVFPEGTRSKNGELGQAQSGVVMIALKSKATLLPIGIKDIKQKKKTKVSIGTPFKLDEYYDRKLDQKEKEMAGEKIMSKIRSELEWLDNKDRQ